MPGLKIFIKIIIFFIASYLLLHAMALLGVFVAVGYLSWWFFVPGQTPCFYCLRQGKQGELCSFCQKRRTASSEAVPLYAVLANVGGILVLTVISSVIVFGEAKLFFNMNIFSSTEKTVSFILPTKEEHTIGEAFPMNIAINGLKVPINVVEANVSFDPKILQVLKIDTIGSFASIFVTKTYDNVKGQIHIIGGHPNPGFFEKQGLLAKVYFEGISPGVGNIVFLPQSVVLANDSEGTNVLKNYPATQYFIKPVNTQSTSLQIQSQGNAVLGARTIKNDQPFLISVLYSVDSFITSVWKSVFEL